MAPAAIAGFLAMNRSRFYIAIGLYLFATAAVAPLAYFSGIGGGARGAASPGFPVHTGGNPLDVTEAIWDCIEFGGFRGLRDSLFGRPCDRGEARSLHTARRDGFGCEKSSLCGPLSRSAVEKITGNAIPANYGAGDPRQGDGPAGFFGPLNEAGTAQGSGQGSPGGDLFPPAFGGPGAPPFVLVAGELTTPPDPEIVPIPIPGGLVLFLSGVAGLVFASKSRRRSIL